MGVRRMRSAWRRKYLVPTIAEEQEESGWIWCILVKSTTKTSISKERQLPCQWQTQQLRLC